MKEVVFSLFLIIFSLVLMYLFYRGARFGFRLMKSAINDYEKGVKEND